MNKLSHFHVGHKFFGFFCVHHSTNFMHVTLHSLDYIILFSLLTSIDVMVTNMAARCLKIFSSNEITALLLSQIM